MLSLKKQLSEIRRVAIAIKCFCKFKRPFGLSIFISFPFHDVTPVSNAHTFASDWKVVTGTWGLHSGILSQLNESGNWLFISFQI